MLDRFTFKGLRVKNSQDDQSFTIISRLIATFLNLLIPFFLILGNYFGVSSNRHSLLGRAIVGIIAMSLIFVTLDVSCPT